MEQELIHSFERAGCLSMCLHWPRPPEPFPRLLPDLRPFSFGPWRTKNTADKTLGRRSGGKFVCRIEITSSIFMRSSLGQTN